MLANDTGRAYWDRHARDYARSMRVLGRPMGRMLELTRGAVRGANNVLEVAAGTGLFTECIAAEARHVVATDYSSAMLDSLSERVATRGLTNVECRQADLYALDFATGSFDVVVAANVLHLIPDLPAGLAALTRVLEPGGKLVVPTFCHDQTLTSRWVSRALALTGFPSARRFSARSLRAAVASTGVEIVREETAPGVIPMTYLEALRA